MRFLTGHSRKGGDDPLYVAEQAADPDSTLVIYMGLATLPGLAAKLMANGLPADTPAVAIERGTTAQQRVVRTCTQYAIIIYICIYVCVCIYIHKIYLFSIIFHFVLNWT